MFSLLRKTGEAMHDIQLAVIVSAATIVVLWLGPSIIQTYGFPIIERVFSKIFGQRIAHWRLKRSIIKLVQEQLLEPRIPKEKHWQLLFAIFSLHEMLCAISTLILLGFIMLLLILVAVIDLVPAHVLWISLAAAAFCISSYISLQSAATKTLHRALSIDVTDKMNVDNTGENQI